MMIIRKNYFFILFYTIMDNIIDTFNINKKTIKEDEILKLNDNQNENEISDIIVKKKKVNRNV